MKYLLDTCVISETISRNPDPVVTDWLEGIDEEYLFVSLIAVSAAVEGLTLVTRNVKDMSNLGALIFNCDSP